METSTFLLRSSVNMQNQKDVCQLIKILCQPFVLLLVQPSNVCLICKHVSKYVCLLLDACKYVSKYICLLLDGCKYVRCMYRGLILKQILTVLKAPCKSSNQSIIFFSTIFHRQKEFGDVLTEENALLCCTPRVLAKRNIQKWLKLLKRFPHLKKKNLFNKTFENGKTREKISHLVIFLSQQV